MAFKQYILIISITRIINQIHLRVGWVCLDESARRKHGVDETRVLPFDQVEDIVIRNDR